MIATILVATALAGAVPHQDALAVMFPDVANPNYYHVMSCRGHVLERTRIKIDRRGAPAPKSGRIVFRCDGPMTTTIERIPLEPGYFRDSDWTWSFEAADGRELIGGVGAKLMRPAAQGLHFYVREGYVEP